MAHDPEVQAAVMAALLEGQGVRELSRSFKIPVQTVSKWKKGIGASRVSTKKVDTKRSRIQDLVESLLETNLETLRLQSLGFRDAGWLADQTAPGVAVLHGVLADKTFRILDSLRPSGKEPGGSEQGPAPDPAN